MCWESKYYIYFLIFIFFFSKVKIFSVWLWCFSQNFQNYLVFRPRPNIVELFFFCIDELAFSQTYLLYWTLVKFPQSLKSPFKYFCPYLTKINLFAYTVTLGHMSQWRYLYIVNNILWGITFADFLSTLWKNLRFQLNYLALTLALETSRSSGGDFLLN